eukprot:7178681-Ditylum_brightwellii.AAC.1
MQEIYLVNLEGPNPYCHDLNARYMDADHICFIVPAPQGHVIMYCKKDRKTSSSAFTRLCMFQCDSDSQLEQNRRVFYIMETRNRSIQLFQSNIQYCNAGQNSFPFILLLPTPRAVSIPIKTSMLGSEPVAFVYNATEVS